MEEGKVTNVNPEDMLEMELILLDNDITFSSGRYTTHSDLDDLVANPSRYRGDDFAIQGRNRHPLYLGNEHVTFNDTYGTFPWNPDFYWEDEELTPPQELASNLVSLRDEAIETYEEIDEILEKVGEIPEWGNMIVEHNDHASISLYPPGEEPEIETKEDVLLMFGVKFIEEGLRGKHLDHYLKEGVDPWRIPYIGFWAPKEDRLDADPQTTLWDYTTGEFNSWDTPPDDALEKTDLPKEWRHVKPEEGIDRSNVEHIGQLLEKAGYRFEKDPREEETNEFVTHSPVPPKTFWVKKY